MKINTLYEIITDSKEATDNEIATILVNIDRGYSVRKIYATDGNIVVLMQDKESTNSQVTIKEESK